MQAIAGLIAGTTRLAALGLFGHAAYSAGLLLIGMARSQRRVERPADCDLPRMVAIVPAHDEESVIERIVLDLTSQHYPEGRLSVLVVADHCTDRTAQLAQRAGARTLVRNEGPRGKSAAIRDALGLVSTEAFDALAVFDADGRVPADYLVRLGRRLAQGEIVVQGRIDAQNADGSWVAAASALGFLAIAAVMQEPRERLGLSTPLMGTGWAGYVDPCGPLLAAAETLTDDLELGAKLAERGIRVAFERDAVLLDEKPVALRTATAQRHRWMQGRWRVASSRLPALARCVLDPKRPVAQRVRAADVTVQLLGPSLLFSAVALGLVGVAARPLAWFGHAAPYRNTALAAGLFFYTLPIPFIARLAPPPSVWRFYGVQPLYLALSIPLAVSGYLRRDETAWRRTPHGS